jgi:hypothetical protein
MASGIGGLNESPLHAALARAVAPEGAAREVEVGGYLIDVVHDGVLIEVQTRHVRRMRAKLTRLLAEHEVRLVLPVALATWIVKPEAGTRRRSPKRGHPADVAAELVSIPDLLDHPRLELELLLIHAEEWRERREGASRRRRGWGTVDRRLVEIVGRRPMRGSCGLLNLVPPDLEAPFGSADLARAGAMRRRTAQQLLYCLRRTGRIAPVDKVGNAVRYRRCERPRGSPSR